MIQRYMTIEAIPVLRPDPIGEDKAANELELQMPPDVYWEVAKALEDMRYAWLEGQSLQHSWRRFAQLVEPCIIAEKGRQWFRRQKFE